jgi:glycosyltransferase involved in cell wall biosynthesis
MISGLILTLNEEQCLERCLESLSWCDELVVVDSDSTDASVEIARRFGARVISRRLENWSSHLNWIFENVRFRGDWVYYSDADEVVTPELRDELVLVAADRERAEVAYRVRFKNMFLGRWIRHSSLYPTWVLRFLRPGRVRWDREVNPTSVVDGPEGRLRQHFLHYSFEKGFEAWYAKHNRYSSQEAREAVTAMRAAVPGLGALLSPHTVERRAALKTLSFRLPCRPVLRFLYMYLARGGFLDGRPGLLYCQLLAAYEQMIDMKVIEMQRREAGLSL